MSDTHTYLGKILDRLPEADLLIHCGDALSRGSLEEFNRFCKTLNNIYKRYDAIFYTAGNHDIHVETFPILCKEIFQNNVPNGNLLLDEMVNYNGLNIYMSPWTPRFFDWAWMYDRKDGKRTWNKIPDETDILITHGMPYGILDKSGFIMGDEVDQHVGCKDLLERIQQINPMIYAGGHLHHGFGNETINHTLYLNASICDEQYIPNRNPWLVEVDTEYRSCKIIN